MKVFQLIKRVGGFCHLHSAYSGIESVKRAPARHLFQSFPHPILSHRPSFLPRSTPMTTVTTTLQSAQSFQEVDSPNSTDFSSQKSLAFSKNANETSSFDQGVIDDYRAIMMEALKKMKKMPAKRGKNLSPEQFLQVQDMLLSDKIYCESPLDIKGDESHPGSGPGPKNSLRQAMDERRDQILKATNFTEEQFDLAGKCIVLMGSMCAKEKIVPPMIVAWSKMKDIGIILKPNFIMTFLYVLGLEERYLDVTLEIATFHDLLYSPTEKSVYLRTKALIAMDDPVGAEKVLGDLADDEEECKRLRTFTPIISYHCEKGDAHSILRIWKQMLAAKGVHFDSETYALILGSLARHGYFHRHAKSISELKSLGLSENTTGPKLLDEILTEMSEDIAEISEEAAKVIVNGFHAGFGISNNSVAGSVSTGSTFQGVPLCSNNGEDLKEKGVLVGRVTIDSTSALCPSTGARLRQLTLDQQQREHVKDTLLKMSSERRKDFRARREKTTKYKFGKVAEEELEAFADWLEKRDGEAFTTFVDGANVAYFGQATFKYSNIVNVVSELERMGERPLVIMPRKYVNASFRLATGGVQHLNTRDLQAMTNLVNAGKMFIVPAECLDDYYWMLASVSDQNGTALEVSPTDGSTARFPGIRPMLISNDLMRDHKLELLEPQLFRRWYNSQVVTYSLSSTDHDKWENRTVRFIPADFFSREVQENTFDKDGTHGTAWHLPVSGWEPRSDRLCIAVAL